MKIAFTAPMKPLDHPVPSGDRTMGRLIVKALRHAGHDVEIASTFRSWSKSGGLAVQQEIRDRALIEADRIATDWENSGARPDLFLTYHLYHKAPDWVGLSLANRFALPYVIIEASRAPKRRTGDWAFGFAEADRSLMRANAVAALHHADEQCLKAVVPLHRLQVVLPFLDTSTFSEAADAAQRKAEPPLKLLAVGMMRPGDKTRSFEVLAEALALLNDLPWHLTLIGDGPNKDHVLQLFDRNRVTWLGALPQEDLPKHYASHDLLVWPAIREAFGFVFLEAQAAGTGVIAGDTFGVPEIVANGQSGLLSPEGDGEAFAANLRTCLENPVRADGLGSAARGYINERHSLTAGVARLNTLLDKAVATHKDPRTSEAQ